MARILLVGVDSVVHGRLSEALPAHRLVAHEGVEPPDLVVADVGRVDAAEVADAYADVPLLGFTTGSDNAGLRRARAAGFDELVEKAALLEQAADLIGALLAPVE
jgi:hypothetical protein